MFSSLLFYVSIVSDNINIIIKTILIQTLCASDGTFQVLSPGVSDVKTSPIKAFIKSALSQMATGGSIRFLAGLSKLRQGVGRQPARFSQGSSTNNVATQ